MLQIELGLLSLFFFLKYCVLYQILLAGNYSFWLPWKFKTIYAGLDTKHYIVS